MVTYFEKIPWLISLGCSLFADPNNTDLLHQIATFCAYTFDTLQ